jgi:hypothetical protein
MAKDLFDDDETPEQDGYDTQLDARLKAEIRYYKQTGQVPGEYKPLPEDPSSPKRFKKPQPKPDKPHWQYERDEERRRRGNQPVPSLAKVGRLRHCWIAIIYRRTGVAQISNVGIVEAWDRRLAQSAAAKLFRVLPTDPDMKLYRIAEIENDWTFFI